MTVAEYADVSAQRRNQRVVAVFQLGYPILGRPHGGRDLDLGALHRLADIPKGDFADELLATIFASLLDGLGLLKQ